MSATDKQEYTLLDTDLTTKLAIMPATSGHLYIELNEAGSGTVEIPLDSTTALLVEAGQFVNIDYRGAARGGFIVENTGKKQANSEEDGGKRVSVSGGGALSFLASAIVEYNGLGSAREFTDKTKGDILKTLIDESQARGELSQITYTFDATNDSASVAWVDTEDFSFPVGMNLLDVVRQFVQTGIDFWLDTSTWELNAYKNGKGTDKSETIYFRVGVNCEEVYSDERANDIVNDYLVAWRDGYLNVSDSTSISAYGRRRGFLDLKNAQSAASATTYAAAKLAQTKNPRKSISVKIYDGVGPRVFVDYDLGDYIMLDVEGVETKYRIYGIQLNWTDDGFADIVVDLNSIFYSIDQNFDRDLNWLMNQWETARDADLFEASFWAAIGDQNIDYTVIQDMIISGRKLYVILYRVGIESFYVYDLDARTWHLLPIVNSNLPKCLAVVGTNVYVGCTHSVQKYDTVAGTLTAIGDVVYSEGPLAEVVSHMAVDGTTLYVSGVFDSIETVAAEMVAAYDTVGGTWSALSDEASYSSPASALAVIDGTLYSAKYKVQSYNGTVWADVGVFPGAGSSPIYKLIGYESNILAGTAETGGIFEWDGANWTLFNLGVDGIVYDIAVYLTDVYVVGTLTGGVSKYSGGAWYPLETGLDNTASEIELDDLNIIVGGIFTTAGGKPAIAVAEYFTNFQDMLDYLENSSSAFNMGAAIHAAPASAITDNDEVPFWEDVSSGLRKITWGNIKATILTWLNSIFTADRVLITSSTGALATDDGLRYDASVDALYLGQTTGLSLARGTYQGNDGAGAAYGMFSWGDSFSSFIKMFRAKGTKTSPTAVTDGTELARLRGAGYDGTTALEDTGTSADIRLVANQTHTPSAKGTRVEIYTTSDGSTTLTKKLTVDHNGGVFGAMSADIKQPNGWVDQDATAAAMTYDSTTQKITITGTFSYYWRGKKYTVTNFESTAHTNTTGHVYRLHSTDGINFVWTTDTSWVISDANILVASVDYYTAYKYARPETHGTDPSPMQHEIDHFNIGTYRQSGGTLDPASYTLASTTAANRRPNVIAAVVHDEGIEHVLPTLTSKTYQKFALSSTDTPNFSGETAEIVPVSGSQPYWNEFTGGTWNQTLMANNSYMSIWLAAQPVTHEAASQAFRFVWFQGQSNGSLIGQQSLTSQGISMGSFAEDEFIFLVKIIIRYTGGNWELTSVDNIFGSKTGQTSSPAGNYLTGVTTDGSLTGNGTTASPLSTASGETTVSAAGTTFLTVNSASQQELTGTANHTHQMEVVSLLRLGQPYKFINNSTGVWTITSSGGNTIIAIPAGVTVFITLILTTGTTAASWSFSSTLSLADNTEAVAFLDGGVKTHATIDSILNTGWTPYITVIPTRTAADDPTYTIQFAGIDLTGVLCEGMPVSWTQNSIVRYGYINSAPSYSGGNTSVTILTILNDASANYDVLDTGTYAITNFKYAPPKQPGFGFPIQPAKWRLTVTDSTNRDNVSAQNTWYYSEFGSINISKPLGEWRGQYSFKLQSGTTGIFTLVTTLSTANNSESTPAHTAGITCNGQYSGSWIHKEFLLPNAAKTTYYQIYKTTDAGNPTIITENGTINYNLYLDCAYL